MRCGDSRRARAAMLRRQAKRSLYGLHAGMVSGENIVWRVLGDLCPLEGDGAMALKAGGRGRVPSGQLYSPPPKSAEVLCETWEHNFPPQLAVGRLSAGRYAGCRGHRLVRIGSCVRRLSMRARVRLRGEEERKVSRSRPKGQPAASASRSHSPGGQPSPFRALPSRPPHARQPLGAALHRAVGPDHPS